MSLKEMIAALDELDKARTSGPWRMPKEEIIHPVPSSVSPKGGYGVLYWANEPDNEQDVGWRGGLADPKFITALENAWPQLRSAAIVTDKQVDAAARALRYANVGVDHHYPLEDDDVWLKYAQIALKAANEASPLIKSQLQTK